MTPLALILGCVPAQTAVIARTIDSQLWNGAILETFTGIAILLVLTLLVLNRPRTNKGRTDEVAPALLGGVRD